MVVVSLEVCEEIWTWILVLEKRELCKRFSLMKAGRLLRKRVLHQDVNRLWW